MKPQVTIQDWHCGADGCENNKLNLSFLTFEAGKVTDIGGNCVSCGNYNHVEIDENTQQFPSFSMNFES